MEKLKETKRYIYYKDCIYSKMCYKMLKVYCTKNKGKYSSITPDGEVKRRQYYFNTEIIK